MTKRAGVIYLFLIGLLLTFAIVWYLLSFLAEEKNRTLFDGQHALADLQTQVAFGPRTPGSRGHVMILDWMRTNLESAGWTVDIPNIQMLGHSTYNVIAYRSKEPPQIILGAHYDTRLFADRDPDPAKRAEPVPGANDGASGVAVLIELARSLPKNTAPVWLVFFDNEDNGHIAGWDSILGSRAFVERLDSHPQAALIIDMVGDANLNIYFEKNSDPTLRTEIWRTAAELGHDEVFISQQKYSMLDDHTPFLQAGIPAVDIIDFDYPYWHTSQDTPDKVSAESLQAVGETLWMWVTNQNQ
jgi:glutaminyl-peptide cyclotransferase